MHFDISVHPQSHHIEIMNISISLKSFSMSFFFFSHVLL